MTLSAVGRQLQGTSSRMETGEPATWVSIPPVQFTTVPDLVETIQVSTPFASASMLLVATAAMLQFGHAQARPGRLGSGPAPAKVATMAAAGEAMGNVGNRQMSAEMQFAFAGVVVMAALRTWYVQAAPNRYA